MGFFCHHGIKKIQEGFLRNGSSIQARAMGAGSHLARACRWDQGRPPEMGAAVLASGVTGCPFAPRPHTQLGRSAHLAQWSRLQAATAPPAEPHGPGTWWTQEHGTQPCLLVSPLTHSATWWLRISSRAAVWPSGINSSEGQLPPCAPRGRERAASSSTLRQVPPSLPA